MFDDNIYQLLNIQHGAEPDFVRKAFRRFARNHHPDLFPGDRLREERFKRVTLAYQKWKLIQNTVNQIRRLRTVYTAGESAVFRRPRFSCHG
jgi:curved DNA-binding protein CbpA